MEEVYSLTKCDLQSLLALVDGCLRAHTVAELVPLLDLLQRVIPFERATICIVSSSSLDSDFFRSVVNHSYDRSWVDAYLANGYQTVDPVIQEALRRNRPVSWDSAFNSVRVPNVRSSRFFEEATEYGLINGVTCLSDRDDACNRTLLSLSLPSDIGAQRFAPIIQTAVAHLHDALTRINQGEDGVRTVRHDAPVALTLRESEVLKWASNGKTCWEIAKILNISERTVKFHFGNAFVKLNVVNRSQAVAKALYLGLMSH
ncbi:MAG: LuxR family transcriptional regulator [Gammaproteobacteria bacterium]|nr:LuxR family transcriptional regulator [Gammaproteobacteria bacterium]